jgi:ABC-type enterobactin transport system permease subunit
LLVFTRKAAAICGYNSRMILGMSTGAFTALHVVISLVGIGSGLVVLTAFMGGKLNAFWNTAQPGLPFRIAQLLTLGIFVWLTASAAKKFAIAA